MIGSRSRGVVRRGRRRGVRARSAPRWCRGGEFASGENHVPSRVQEVRITFTRSRAGSKKRTTPLGFSRCERRAGGSNGVPVGRGRHRGRGDVDDDAAAPVRARDALVARFQVAGSDARGRMPSLSDGEHTDGRAESARARLVCGVREWPRRAGRSVIHHQRLFRCEFLRLDSETRVSLRGGFHGDEVLDLVDLTTHGLVVRDLDLLPDLV